MALNDNSYNIVTTLSEKAQAVQLYDQFIEDAEDEGTPECVELFKKLKAQDEALVDELKEHVDMLIKSGKF